MRLKNLDYIRGIAAILVAIFHFHEMIHPLVENGRTMFIRQQYLMVDLFCIMSGFIMCHVYQKTFSIQCINSKNYLLFLKNRFARIYPLHFFTLFFMVIFVSLTHWTHTFQFIPLGELIFPYQAIFSHIFLLQSLGVNNFVTWNVPSWSISGEWWAYILFPFLVFFVSKMNKIGLFIGFCLLGLMYYGMVYHLSFIRSLPYFLKPQAILDFSWDYGFLRCLVDFLMGMLVFQIFDNQYFKPIFSNIIFAVFIVLGIAYTMHRAFSDVLSVMLFPTIILLAAYQNKLFDWFLDYPIFEKLGDWSYSIYLNQSCLLYVFVFFANVYGWKLNTLGFLNAWLFCLIYLIFLIVISTFTYQFIEKPCRKWFKNL